MPKRKPDSQPHHGGQSSSFSHPVFAKKAPPAPDLKQGQAYPDIDDFLATDKDNMIYRRFAHLHAQRLLYIQAIINRLEKDLDSLHKVQGTVEPDPAIARSDRTGLIEIIQRRLSRYSK